MKATQEQYNECVELYNKVGPSAIYEYAEKNGITASYNISQGNVANEILNFAKKIRKIHS